MIKGYVNLFIGVRAFGYNKCYGCAFNKILLSLLLTQFAPHPYFPNSVIGKARTHARARTPHTRAHASSFRALPLATSVRPR